MEGSPILDLEEGQTRKPGTGLFRIDQHALSVKGHVTARVRWIR